MDSNTSSPISIQSGIDVGGTTNVAGQVILDIKSKPVRKHTDLRVINAEIKRIAELFSKLNK